MRVLVACEESQAVCKEFRRLDHEAYSCDIQSCTGGAPQWHIMGDVLALINGYCSFKTCDGVEHFINGRWDMLIAFPPCTHLAVSGAKWFEEKRKDGRQRAAVDFFCKMIYANCERIAVENPVNIISGEYVREWFPDLAEKYYLPLEPSQHIQPYYFGDAFEKTTALWLNGLPKLKATKMVTPPPKIVYESGKSMPAWYAKAFSLPPDERSRIRSKTFPGVARAMAEQWGGKNRKPAYVQRALF